MDEKVLKIAFVGDVFPANLPYNRGFGVGAVQMDDVTQMALASRIKALFPEGQILVGNLESPVFQESPNLKNEKFAGSEGFLKMLKRAGFELLSLANNHMMEHGMQGLDSTKQLMENNGLDYIGVDNDGMPKCFVLDRNGIRIGFVAYNDIDNQYNPEGTICAYNRESVIESIGRLKAIGLDYICVVLHWGDEFINRASKQQMEDAHLFVDAGANFVIGSHPHVVQPVEDYHGGLICYSLGNFVFDMKVPRSTRVGMTISLSLGKDDYTYRESFIWLDKDYFPIKLNAKKEKRIRELLLSEWKEMQLGKYFDSKYNREKKCRRNRKRLMEKAVLVGNWFRFDSAVRSEMKQYYRNKLMGKLIES